jgi:hypothetical protein
LYKKSSFDIKGGTKPQTILWPQETKPDNTMATRNQTTDNTMATRNQTTDNTMATRNQTTDNTMATRKSIKKPCNGRQNSTQKNKYWGTRNPIKWDGGMYLGYDSNSLAYYYYYFVFL